MDRKVLGWLPIAVLLCIWAAAADVFADAYESSQGGVDTSSFLTAADLAGYVQGPGSSTDNRIARWDGAGGDTLQDSAWSITDAGDLLGASEGQKVTIGSGSSGLYVPDASTVQLSDGVYSYSLKGSGRAYVDAASFGIEGGLIFYNSAPADTRYSIIYPWGATDGRLYVSAGDDSDWGGIDALFFGLGNKDAFSDSEVFISSKASTARTALFSQSNAESLTDGLFFEIGETTDETRIGSSDTDYDPVYLANYDTDVGIFARTETTLLNESGATLGIKSASEELTALSGSSASTTNLVPAGCRILFVTTRVTTTITGATTFDVGDGSDVDRYGAGIALTAGTTTDETDATADPMSWSASAQDVTLTKNGSNFSGGAVRVVAFYLDPSPPGS